MAITKKIIGRIPVCFGSWYAKSGGWSIKNRVTLYGSEFESLHDNNTVPPAEYDETTQTVTFNENDWRIISNGTEAWLADNKINDLGIWVENEEFIRVYTDKNDKVLFGIREDGSVEWSKGIPTPIKNELEKMVDEILSASDVYEEDEEFIHVIKDGEDKFLFGIRYDGSIEWNKGVPSPIMAYTEECMQRLYAYVDKQEGGYSVISSPEYIYAVVDASDKFIFGVTVEGEFVTWKSKETGGGASPSDVSDYFGVVDDKEGRSEMTLDRDGRVLSYRDRDGVKVESVGVKTPYIDLSKQGLEKLENELNISPDNIGLYKSPNLPKYGTTNIKTEKFFLTAHPSVESIADVTLVYDVADNAFNAGERMTIAHYYAGSDKLQHFAFSKEDDAIDVGGTYYIKSTLTDNGDGTYTVEDDSIELPGFVKKVGAKYVHTSIMKVSGVCYYADTLGYRTRPNVWNWSKRDRVIDGYSVTAPYDSELGEGKAKLTLVEAVEVVGPACVDAWTVEDWDVNYQEGSDIGKKYEHYCTCDVDFGTYLAANNVHIGVKRQGNSTQAYRKRNFRYTFYKSNGKKDKIKIGEMLRLSKFNLKASHTDNTRIKELIVYRLFEQIWKNRPITDRYDWDGGKNGYYHGASGNITGFPINLYVNNSFYGIYEFALPKDAKNYMFDDEDEDTGMLVCGASNTANAWAHELPFNVKTLFDSEMDSDDLDDYPGIEKALTDFLNFVNNRLYDGSDGNTYSSEEVVIVDDTYYVTSTLVPSASSVTAERTQDQDMAYRGSDGELYILSELTEIDGVLYVTSTLEGGVPVSTSVTATNLNRHIYVGSNGERYLSTDLTKINDVYYVTDLIVWETTGSSVSAELIPFDKDNAPERLDIIGFMDYFICLQVLMMIDSAQNNVMLYSGPEKKKMFPFFYDLDSCISIASGTTADILDPGVALCPDVSFWVNFSKLYWDDIVNRYCELRKTYLTIDFLRSVYEDIAASIPEADFTKENAKWGTNTRASNFESRLSYLEERFEWADKTYFNI